MEVTEGGSGPSGCVQNRGMTRAGARAARAARTATGVTGINSSGIFFIFLEFCIFTMDIHPYTGAYTAYRMLRNVSKR